MQVRRSASLTSPESSMLRYLKMRKAVSCILRSFQKTLSARQFRRPLDRPHPYPDEVLTAYFFGRMGFWETLEFPALPGHRPGSLTMRPIRVQPIAKIAPGECAPPRPASGGAF